MLGEHNPSTPVLPLRSNVLVGGGYAWLVTVAGPAFSVGISWPPFTAAVAALAALVGGVLVSGRWPFQGRALTLYGFVGFSAFTWFLLGPSLEQEALAPVTAGLGGLGWMLFALAWGAVRTASSVPEEAPNAIAGVPLPPRDRQSWLSTLAIGLGVAGALLVWGLAWRVRSGPHGLFSHGAALICAVALIAAGARIATRVDGNRGPGPVRGRAIRALPALIGTLLAAVLGLIGWLWAD